MATVYSAIPFVLGLGCLILYPIGKKLSKQIDTELNERRKQYAQPAGEQSAAQA